MSVNGAAAMVAKIMREPYSQAPARAPRTPTRSTAKSAPVRTVRDQLCQLIQQRGDLQHRGVRGHGGLGVVVAGDVQELGDRRRAAPGELDVAVTDLVRLLGRPAADLRTAGRRAAT
jgi:hypothetical protein